MPDRLFDQFDLINVVNGFTLGPVDPAVSPPNSVLIPFAIVYNNPSSFGFAGNNSTTVPPPVVSPTIEGAAIFTGTGVYEVTADVDFDNFPPIPDNVVVTEILVSLQYTAWIIGEATTFAFDPFFDTLSIIEELNGYTEYQIFQRLVSLGTRGDPSLSCNEGSLAPVTLNTLWDATTLMAQFGFPSLTRQQLVSFFGPYIKRIQSTNQQIIQALTKNDCGVNASVEMSMGFQFNDWSMLVTYTELPYMFTMNPPSASTVEKGQTIRLTSPGTDPLVDLNLAELTLSMACGVIVPDVQTPQLLIFTIPASCSGAGLMDLVATGNGTQFSGDIVLGTLTILLANASGIYTLVKGKTSDTLYSSARDGTTYNVKIPNPFARTGFIGG